MKIEKIVSVFYEGLEQGKLLGRRCKECGAIEFPPRYACNTCGYHETEWVELPPNGMLRSLITVSTLNADPWNDDLGHYCYGIVDLGDGVSFNATVTGVKKKQAKILRDRLPLPVHAKFEQREGYKTLFFEFDDEVMESLK